MRQIKFRILDKTIKCYHYPDNIYEAGRFIEMLEYSNIEYIIEQFTGLKDKNNKEIYEGDICKGEYCASNAGIYKNLIKWDIQSACFEFANSPLWTWEYLEVIGNIYENPELLK